METTVEVFSPSSPVKGLKILVVRGLKILVVRGLKILVVRGL